MFKASFFYFFIKPLKKIHKDITGNLRIIFSLLKNNILLKFEPKNDQRTVVESATIFKAIILLVFFNLTFDYIKDKNGANIEKNTIEIVITAIYLMFFWAIYYIGFFFNKIYKQNVFTSFGVSFWNFYSFGITIILQLFDGFENQNKNGYSIMNIMLFMIFFHLLAFYIKLKKHGLFKARDLIYIFSLFTLLTIGILFLTTNHNEIKNKIFHQIESKKGSKTMLKINKFHIMSKLYQS